MVPMPSTEIESQYHPLLLRLARQAIVYGVHHGGKQMEFSTENVPPCLLEHRASFVTLKIDGDLRGCIGSLQAYRPLVVDVLHNAYAAAFKDPRFNPMTHQELDDLQIDISILSPPQELAFDKEGDLLDQLRPGIDGLILKEGVRRGTFLPSVWQFLPDKRQFLENLKLKAGLPAGYWSKEIQVYRYTTEAIKEDLDTV